MRSPSSTLSARHEVRDGWRGRFYQGAAEAFENWRRYALASSAFSGVLGAVAALQLAVTFLILVPRYQAGLLSIGDIVLFNTLLLQLNQPFHLVGMAIKEMVEAAARFRPLAAMWIAPEVAEPADPVPYHPSQGSLVFQDVTFRYPNGRGISGLSFAVRRGTPTFLVGETGSGKSTVLRLLLKGLEPIDGRILADETDLARITSDDWFAHVGVVPQDVALLNDTPVGQHRAGPSVRSASITQGGDAGFDPLAHRGYARGLRNGGGRAGTETIGRGSVSASR
ncbi:ABC transporter ATP-binding protein [Sinorhizobium meliloti]|nr:ABC transporter ATP-binding protein [Sinorhizobium meliloti]